MSMAVASSTTTGTYPITITGTGGHAAFPHGGTDPIITGAAIVTALQSIISKNVAATTPAVVTVGLFQAGFTHNVIPSTARLFGTIRTFDQLTRDMIWRRVKEIAQNVAASYNCQAQVTILAGYPAVINDARATQFALEVASQALGKSNVDEMPAPLMGGEDFAYYGQQIPTCFSFFGLIAPQSNSHPHLHTPKFDFPDAAIIPGVKLMCRWALAADRMIR
jgi:hippurate hydrolase